MRFMMLVIPKGYEKAEPTRQPDPKQVEQMMKYNKALSKAGVLLSLMVFMPPSAGVRVSFNDGKPKVTDGPFAEAKECVGGYWMIQVKSREEAIEWASGRRCRQRDHRSSASAGNGGLLAGDSGSRAPGRASRRHGWTKIGGRGRARHFEAIDAVWKIESPKLIASLARIARCRHGGGPRAGCARRRPGTVARRRHPPQSRRLADGHCQAPRHRSVPAQQAAGRKYEQVGYERQARQEDAAPDFDERA